VPAGDDRPSRWHGHMNMYAKTGQVKTVPIPIRSVVISFGKAPKAHLEKCTSPVLMGKLIFLNVLYKYATFIAHTKPYISFQPFRLGVILQLTAITLKLYISSLSCPQLKILKSIETILTFD